MNKLEKRKLMICDLARLNHESLKEYRKFKVVSNAAYKLTQQKAEWENYDPTHDWDVYYSHVIEANIYQHAVERNLPSPDLFNSVYRMFNKMTEEELNQSITSEEVLEFIGHKTKIGRIRPSGTIFYETKNPKREYQIIKIKDGVVWFNSLYNNKNYAIGAGKFQNKIKNEVIKYKFPSPEVREEKKPTQLTLFDFGMTMDDGRKK